MRRMTLTAAAGTLVLLALIGIHTNMAGAQSNGSGGPNTVFLPITIGAGDGEADTTGSGHAGDGIWLSPEEIASLPTQGAAWNNVVEWAEESTNSPRLDDQDDQTDAAVVAKALVYARTGEQQYRDEVVEAIDAVVGSESSANILALARNLAGYVIAADLVGYDDPAFRSWLDDLRFEVIVASGPDLSLVSCHEERPNNFGTHCGVSRLAVALYLGDQAEVQRVADVFRGWLGDRSAYAGFNFGSDMSWHCDASQPVAINPPGCSKDGHSLDGVLPDDQRRGGSYSWPPPQENYVWEALQGAVAQAWMLERAGYAAFEWQSQALLRATRWMYQESGFPAAGDDSGTPWLINDVYGSNFSTDSPARPGKNGLGFYDWYTAR